MLKIEVNDNSSFARPTSVKIVIETDTREEADLIATAFATQMDKEMMRIEPPGGKVDPNSPLLLMMNASAHIRAHLEAIRVRLGLA